MMSLKTQLVQIILGFCLVLSLGSFVVMGVATQDMGNMWGNQAGIWSQVNDNDDWTHMVSGGCQLEGGDSGLGTIS